MARLSPGPDRGEPGSDDYPLRDVMELIVIVLAALFLTAAIWSHNRTVARPTRDPILPSSATLTAICRRQGSGSTLPQQRHAELEPRDNEGGTMCDAPR